MNSTYKIITLLAICMVVTFNSFSQNKFKVTLDAGHGGKDWGATYHGHVEKNIALSVVLKVGELLENQPSIQVDYTRKTDVFIDLIERAEIANRLDSNIFVSIHCNANKNTAAFGTETFIMGMAKTASNLAAAKKENEVITLEKDYKQKYEGFDPNSPETLIGMTLMQEEYLENSIALASKVQDRFKELSKKSRGLSQAPFMVLHKAYMPRVLIEMGFISNPQEGAYLDSEEGQNEIATAIANAIISYKKEYYGVDGSNNEVIERPSKKIIDTPTEPKKEIKTEISKKETKPAAQAAQKAPKEDIVFKIQIAASSKQIEPIANNFKGLDGITVSSNANINKYLYGETSDYSIAKKNLEEAKSKGYASAFIIACKDGKLVSLKEVVK